MNLEQLGGENRMKLDRMEKALLFDGLRSQLEKEKEIIEDKRESEDSYRTANEIITLEHLVRTLCKTFEMEELETKILLEEIEYLKSHANVTPEIMKETEEKEKDWFKDLK